ncbi:MAG: hypothetical protein RLZZ324_894, partial [Candidatus Parcubacteria bacterium]
VDHAFALSGLASATTYHFQACATDSAGNQGCSADQSFTTAAPPDVAPPVISGIATTSATLDGVTVVWNTDEPADSAVDFGATSAYGVTLSDAPLVTAHSLTLTGLASATTFHFRVASADAAANLARSGDFTFTTSSPPPVIDVTAPGPVTGLAASRKDADVTLTWTNPSDADFAGVTVVRRAGSVAPTAQDGVAVYTGTAATVVDAAVPLGATYYYSAFAFDAASNYASPATVAIVVPAPVPAPATALPPPAPAAAPQAPAPQVTAPPPAACSDSDAGRDYGAFGTATYDGTSLSDTCVDGNTLNEQYCFDPATISTETHTCASNEICASGICAARAGVTASVICGNGICESGESATSCAEDCTVPPPPPAPEPVPVPAPTPSTGVIAPVVPEIRHLQPDDLEFFAGDAQTPLTVNADELTVYPFTRVKAHLPDSSILKPIVAAAMVIDGTVYPMAPTGSFTTFFTAPADVGEHVMSLTVTYDDASSDSVRYHLVISPPGMVYETIGGTRVPVAGARVTVFTDTGASYGFWDGAAAGQRNPQESAAKGAFAFVVPSGTYRLRVDAEGFLPKETLAFPASNVIPNQVEIVRLPPEVKNLGDALQTVAFATKVSYSQTRDFAENPIVEQKTRSIAVPAITSVMATDVAVGTAANAAPYLMYLYSLLTHPAQLFGRRKRKKWGVAYNALTKLPIDLAIVRLFDARTGRIIRSVVTDKDGRYFFIVGRGEYRISVVKAGFAFPSALLATQKEDGAFLDVNHGENISVTEEVTLTANLPLDPAVVAEKSMNRVLFEGIGRRFQQSLGLISILAMTGAAIISPQPWVLAVLTANVMAYGLFHRLAVPSRPKNWGTVHDLKTRRPLQNAIVRIFDTRFNKLLETQVTDILGRYGFLVGENTYVVTYEKPGYAKEQKGPVAPAADKKGANRLVTMDVALRPAEVVQPITRLPDLPPPEAAPQAPQPPAGTHESVSPQQPPKPLS